MSSFGRETKQTLHTSAASTIIVLISLCYSLLRKSTSYVTHPELDRGRPCLHILILPSSPPFNPGCKGAANDSNEHPVCGTASRDDKGKVTVPYSIEVSLLKSLGPC